MLSKFTRRGSGGLAVLGLAALAVPGLAQSKTYQFTFPTASPIAGFPYTDTTHPASYAPSFVRPNNASTPIPTSLAQTSGVNVFFDMHTFTVPTTGIYDILSNCAGPSNVKYWWDNFTLLYGSDITSGAAYTQFLNDSRVGCLYANQDFNASAANNFYKAQSGFTTLLNAGQTYTLVTTSNSNAGQYSYTDPVTSVFTYSNGGPFVNTVTSKPVLGAPVLNVNGTIGPTAAAQSYLAPTPNGTAIPTTANTVAAYYDKQNFTVPVDGSYYILTTATATNNWNPTAALYGEDPSHPGVSGFDPANSLNNVLYSNAGYVGPGTDTGHAFMTTALKAGKIYTIVVSGTASSTFGPNPGNVGYYTNTVTPLIGGNKDVWSGDTTYGDGNFMSPAGATAATSHKTWYYDYDPYYPAGSNPNGSPDPDNYYKLPKILPYVAHQWIADVTGTVTFSTTPDPSNFFGSYMYLYEGAANTMPFDPGYDFNAATTGDEGLRQSAGNNALNNLVGSSTSIFGTGTISYPVTKGNVYNLVVSNYNDQNFGPFTASIDVTGSGYIGTTAGGPTYNRPWDGTSYTLTLGTQSSGTFSLALNGVGLALTTFPNGIPYNVTLTALQTALGSSYTVAGTPAAPTVPGVFTIKITGGRVAGPLTVNASGLGSPASVSVTEGPDAATQSSQNPSGDTLTYLWYNSPLATATHYNAKTLHAYTSGSNTITVKSSSPAAKLWVAVYAAPFTPGSAASLVYGVKATNGQASNPITGSLLYLVNTSGASNSVTFSPYFVANNDYVIVVSGDTNATVGPFSVNFAGANFNQPIYTANGSNSYGPGNYTTKVLPNGSLPPVSLDIRYTGNGELYYEADNFTITTEGDYNIQDDCTLADGSASTSWDNFVTLYHDSVNVNNPNSFDSANPLKNALIASDGLTSSSITITPIHLTPGVYTLVTSEGSANLTYGHTYGYNAVVAPITTPATAVVSYTGALQQIATAPADGFLTKLPTLPSVTTGVTPGPPTANSSTSAFYFNAPYKAIPITIPATGVYSLKVTSLAPQALWLNEFLLYKGTFDRTNPITNCVFGAAGAANSAYTVVTSLVSGATLTAGNYTLVVTGTTNASFGPFTAEVTAGYASYPPNIPDATSAGVAGSLPATITVADGFSVGTLNSVTLTGISHPRIGDLTATLKHGATTIELFDRVNRFTTGSADYGSKSIFTGGDYTFAATGSDFSAASGTNLAIVDPTLIFGQYLNGTVGQSSTLTGNFSAFNGQSVAGDWVLNVTDNKNGGTYFNGPVGGYSGFKFNVTPVTAGLSGKLTFEGIVANANPQNVTFTFRPTAGGTAIVMTQMVGPDGNYTVTGIPLGAYTAHIKGDKYLAANLTVDLTVGSQTGGDAFLLAGDCNNDNNVDPTDFNVFVTAYNSAANIPGTGYDETADLNDDGFVDPTDFGLFVGNYNKVGAN